MSKARNFAFTINNYLQEDLAGLAALNGSTQLKYMIRGLEVGESGTPHVQGYVMFNNAKTIVQAKAFIGCARAHFEIARGNSEHNIAYCSKDGNFVEFGQRPRQGGRSDLDAVKAMVREGRPMHDIVEVATSYQSVRFAELYRKYQPLVERPAPLVKWFYGPTGTGKTRMAYHQLGYAQTWASSTNLKWFDGYDGQPNVIFDDFRASHIAFTQLLRLLDRYPLRVETKGGSVNWEPRVIIITAPDHPNDTYVSHQIQENISQLLRRITEIRYFEILDETLYTNPDAAQNLPPQENNVPQEENRPPQVVQA